jgi:hypothetical protein
MHPFHATNVPQQANEYLKEAGCDFVYRAERSSLHETPFSCSRYQ